MTEIESLREQLAKSEREVARLREWLHHWSFCAWWHDAGPGATEAIQAAIDGKTLEEQSRCRQQQE